ncbi:hypothetical protein BCV69DRAFT_32922 [Microstroma glucosiphilum]|uniref:Secreted protein n=1 Tax=Pseudomicrostroma glucosiphilum TaxID=1684307 RepID=A0A316U3R7_9BASI|nr:hypothetical protein BCV69DRAFT_32922 [Pseudomicrostroma glucosiphilum]PWN19810.1 hypothetical protein BCV69DRAFT_32922 [Pseudomicrostroma glucosiphilum]
MSGLWTAMTCLKRIVLAGHIFLVETRDPRWLLSSAAWLDHRPLSTSQGGGEEARAGPSACLHGRLEWVSGRRHCSRVIAYALIRRDTPRPGVFALPFALPGPVAYCCQSSPSSSSHLYCTPLHCPCFCLCFFSQHPNI